MLINLNGGYMDSRKKLLTIDAGTIEDFGKVADSVY